MTAEAAEHQAGQAPGWRQRRRWRALVALLLMLGVALAVLWSQRRGIAEGFVDRELTRRGVAARYTVADIGLSTQRLTNVVIGDPADPDLVADWVEVRTDLGLGGAEVAGIAAGHVRMRARLSDGTLSFGAIDRLLPPPSGKPFAFPAIDARLGDVRMRIEAPQGVVGVKLSGSGRLDDGFVGRIAATSDRLEVADCGLARVRGAFGVRVASARPSIEGPMRIGEAACGDGRLSGFAADLVVTLGAALDRWTGRVRGSAASAAAAGFAAGPLLGRATFDGTARATAGAVSLKAMGLASDHGDAQVAAIDGRYRAGQAGAEFAGRARIEHGRAAPGLAASLRAFGANGAGTPLAPLARALSNAAAAAVGDLTVDAAIEAVARDGARALRLSSLDAVSASGARASLGGERLRFGRIETGGRLTIGGGGLPDAVVALAQTPGGLSGRATIRPYAAGGAELALTPVGFAAAGGAITRIATTATLSGPLGDGRIEALRLPIDARWRGRRLVVNPACAPLEWRRLAIAGLVLNPARLALCPEGGALVTLDGGRLGGGARIAAPRLSGSLGGTPITLAAEGSRIRLGDGGFALSRVAARLGSPERVTRLDIGALDGRIAGDGVAGSFAGTGGQIGNVPLLLSDAAGDWSLTDGVLALKGGLGIADAQIEAPRFKPLASDDVALRLVDGRITATGTLRAPKANARVADVAIEHRLSNGSGGARLTVDRLSFADKGLQPDDLTPLTFGVIAAVDGTVSGRGDIAWTQQGVTSTGRFTLGSTDLAAAFGPVTGLRTEIVFTDLLGLVSAPGQVATIETVNPGIAVENGEVRYQLTGESRVQVEGGRWPFAGGELTLDPTLLDFDASQERRMTFRVARADAGAFLQQFDFDNLNATGTFDGVLPMVFDQSGGRIEGGRLAARAGGSLAYIGTITEEDVGFWGNLAFQALKALDYRNLDITLNGPLAGEMVTEIRFAGVSQGEGTKSNFIIRRLARLPFVFNITVRAPFRQIVDSVRSYYDPSRLIERNLPALLEERKRREQGLLPSAPTIQPPESEKRP